MVFHHVERYVNGMVDVLAKHRGGYSFPFGSTYYVIIFVLGNALIPLYLLGSSYGVCSVNRIGILPAMI